MQFRSIVRQSRPLSTFLKTIVAPILLCGFLTACSSSDPTVVKGEFSAMGVKGTIDGQNVSLDLSGLGNCATNINSMVISVEASGASISPDPRVARDYSRPVQFTLTAPDGTNAVYTVTVKGAGCLGTPSPTPTACTAAAINPAEPYSLVFKGCDANNVAEYYDKTECVRQNSTGLIWQGQTAAGTGLRGSDQFKTNYDSTVALQRWNGEAYVAPTQPEIDASTNSMGFKNAVNATSLCGSSAWRLPTKDELLGIVKGGEARPRVDMNWFLNTPVIGKYWSSSPSPYPEYAYNAFNVNFDDGNAYLSSRDNYGGGVDDILVRLVRN